MTIVPRGGRFGAKVWDRASRKYVWLGTFGSRRLAEQAIEDHARLHVGGVPTVADWGTVWLSEYARDAPATRQLYRQAVNEITVRIGGLRLDEVTRRMAQKLANEWPQTRLNVARTMWGDARRDEVCAVNPWTNLRLKQSRGRMDLKPLTETQVMELADLAGRIQPAVRDIILFLAYTGVRPGEMCALKWEDVDFGERELHVRRNLDNTGVEKLPKNGKMRVVTIPPAALHALERVRGQWVDGVGYVFRSISGRRLHKASLHYLWRPVALAWETDIDLYELRHAAATMLLERGVAHADVAVQLGHEDGGALVMRLYGHPSKDLARGRLKTAYDEPLGECGRGVASTG